MLTERKKTGSSLLKLSSSSVLLVPGLMYLKGAINADSILTFSGGETRDTQSQQEGSGRDVLIVLSIKAADQCRPNMGAEAKHKRARVCTQGRSSVTSAKITMYTGRHEEAYTETQKDLK